MSELFLLPLGVGDAFSARYYSACVALRVDDSWLLVDCPHPIRKMMAEAGAAAGVALDLDRVSGVVLTHLHADHCSGLEVVGFFARFILGRRMPLLAHPDVAARLWSGHLSAGMEWVTPGPGQAPSRRSFEEFFELTPLDEAAPVRHGPFEIRCRRTLHSVPTTALSIATEAGSVGLSADTTFDASLLEWLAHADLVVHETGPPPLHTAYEELAAQPAELLRRMRLTHYSDRFDLTTSIIEPLQQGRPCIVRKR